MYQFTIPGRPRPKERPRVLRSGRTFTPPRTREGEAEIKRLYHGPKFEGPVEVHLVFLPNETRVVVKQAPTLGAKHHRADIDNLIKLVLDGLQGAAYENDNQVVYVEASK